MQTIYLLYDEGNNIWTASNWPISENGLQSNAVEVTDEEAEKAFSTSWIITDYVDGELTFTANTTQSDLAEAEQDRLNDIAALKVKLEDHSITDNELHDLLLLTIPNIPESPS